MSVSPTPLLIAGHQRSGTSMLVALLNSHPDIALTFEFKAFVALNSPPREYVSKVRKQWFKRPPFQQPQQHPVMKRFDSAIFLFRYLTGILRHRHRSQIDLPTVIEVMHQIFPYACIVGDKWPDYIWEFDKLTRLEPLKCLVIYRDGRDVTSSALHLARTQWRNQKWVTAFTNVDQVARRWVSTIRIMQRNASRAHIIRYEELVQQPEPVLTRLGGWLGIDPGVFNQQLLDTGSIGKYRQGLTPPELATVLEIAGPTLVELGYEL